MKGDSDYVWALKDINFEVQQGEVLANGKGAGAGKDAGVCLGGACDAGGNWVGDECVGAG